MSKPSPFSPREFLKARRPERFSDSVVENRSTLDRAILEYHLDTLTKRSQETDFQNFARHLAEREVCPNLLPQTGPTGGGDSKVDTETYPVADSLSIGWYSGIGREASSERWAFAISAKADWRSKVRSDLKKIAGTDRGYSKTFFITNQFVPDKVRSEFEEDLRKTHGFDVRILDRNWILDKVFTGRHESLAIDDLRLQPSLRTEIRKGPRDLEREQALNDAEARIKAATQPNQFSFAFVDDCITAAVLSRGLDHPRTETDGRFIRAERVANAHGTYHQKILCAYEYAWTAYWWYEDFGLVVQLYGMLEERVKSSLNSYDLELLSHLWLLLFTMVRVGQFDSTSAKLDSRTITLLAELERLSGEGERPSNALHARSLRLVVQMLHTAPNGIDDCLEGMRSVILESKGLIGFPLQPLVEILGEIGEIIDHSPNYETLHETIIQVISEREGEIAAAQLLLRRGAQLLDINRPVDALRLLGRAFAKLAMHESRHELVSALSLCGAAYERIGLLWAARGCTLTAASIATSEYWTYSDVTIQQAACYRRMKWLELQLGRVPHVLEWHNVDSSIRRVLEQQGYDTDRFGAGESDFDGILGMLLLRTDIWELNRLTSLPETLKKLGLYAAALALRFALGHEDELPPEVGSTHDDLEATRRFFIAWRDQPAGRELPASPFYYNTRTVSLKSVVLGCHVVADCENNATCLAIAESLLAALESLLASGVVDHIVPREPTLTIRIKRGGFGGDSFTYDARDIEGRPHMDVICCDFDPNKMSRESQEQVRSKLGDVLATILGRVFMFANLEKDLSKLFGDDRALERSLSFTSSFIVQGNVLGHEPRTDISNWQEKSANDFPLKRAKAWDADVPSGGSDATDGARIPTGPSNQEQFASFVQSGRVKHSQVESVSPIREALWNEAKWLATGLSWTEGNRGAPVLAPVFQNAGAAAQIFRNWRNEFGDADTSERLRVSIIRGISNQNPYWYRVVFSGNPAGLPRSNDVRFMVMMSKIHTMHATTDANVRSFLSNYEAAGHYLLAHCVAQNGTSDPELVLDDSIRKQELHVREAWQIGRNDLDSVGILPSDEPFIPPDATDVPVIELLRWKQERLNESNTNL